jgi:signal transduction histidine kinase/DNA-binding response OmpR family regulator
MAQSPRSRTRRTMQRTARKKSTARPAFAYDGAFHALSDAVWIIDAKNNTAFCNSRFEKIFAIDAAEWTGKPAAALLKATAAMFKKPDAWIAPLTKATAVHEDRLDLQHPTLTHLHRCVDPVIDGHGKTVGQIWILTDISERVRIEQSVEQSYRDLEKKKFEFEQRRSELEKAYRQIEEMRKTAEDANRLKSQFLSNMSHELRTPLNSILALSSILLARMDGDLTEEQEKQIKIIEKSGKSLLHLINDILDISKIEAGRMDLIVSEYDVADFLHSIEITIRPMVREADLEFAIEREGHIDFHSTDENKLKQILLNLLSNAIKFTPKGKVTLSVKRTKFDDVLEFCVADTGIGIEAGHFDSIFDPFRQLDGTATRKYGGTGLGLALTKKLVELLGGRIWVESETGKGSRFSFALPAQRIGDTKAHAPVVETTPDEPRDDDWDFPESVTIDPRKNLILVIEDDREAVYIMKKALESETTQVVAVRDGITGLQTAERLKPALITLDIMLPQKDGWEVLQSLKKNEATKDIPVVIISMMDNRKLGFSLGASDYMVKPVQQDMLVKRLTKLSTEKGLKKILVVDDDLSQAELVEEILESDDFLSEVATSGDMAIRLAAKKHYDLIILDLMMPQTDGFAVLRSLQEKDSTESTPVLILTGKLLTRDDQKKLSGENYHVFQKTMFSRESLLQEIHRILGTRQN